MYCYRVSNLAVHSEIILPGLAAIPRRDRAADVTVRRADVPVGLPGASQTGATWEMADERLLLRIPGIVRFLLAAGSDVTFELEETGTAADAAIFVLGTVFGILLQQRGHLVLHASAVRVGGKAVLFCGPSGAGKSSLAAALGQQGCPLLSDDACAIGLDRAGVPVAHSDGRQFKLWAQAVERLHLSDRRGAPLRSQLEKFYVEPLESAPETLPLGAIYVLRETRPPLSDGIEEPNIVDAALLIRRNAYRPRLVAAMRQKPQYFQSAANIVANAGVFTLTRPLDFARMPDVIRQLDEHWRKIGLRGAASRTSQPPGLVGSEATRRASKSPAIGRRGSSPRSPAPYGGPTVMQQNRVWLASYLKSGNTWLRLLIGCLSLKDGEALDINTTAESSGIASGRGPFDRLTLIDSGLLTHDEIDRLRPRVYEELALAAEEESQDELRTPSAVRFIKAHDAYTLTPLGEPLLAGARGAKGAIVIVRDPRDVAPSLANHDRTTIDKAISLINDRDGIYAGWTDRQSPQFRQRLLDWSGHVASWLDQRDIPVHLLRYEDLKRDTVGTLLAAMRFAGFPATPEAAARAASLTAFDDLRDQERDLGFGEAPPNGNAFFRRGEAGAWRDELTAEQVARIESAHGVMMDRLGYELSTGLPALPSRGVIARL